jgi:hypothetical protein
VDTPSFRSYRHRTEAQDRQRRGDQTRELRIAIARPVLSGLEFLNGSKLSDSLKFIVFQA